MPLYDISLEDGRKLRIEADDAAAAGRGAAYWLQSNPAPESGWGSSIQAGAASAVTGAGQSLKYLGADQLGQKIEDVGRGMAPANYKPAMDEAKAPTDDQYKLSDLPGVGKYLPDWGFRGIGRSLAEGAPTLAADLTGARLGAGVGAGVGAMLGPAAPASVPIGAALGGLVGGVGTHFLQSFGPAAKETAVKRTGDEAAQPTTQDKLIGGGTAAAESALQALPIGKVLGGRAVTGTGIRGAAQAAGNVAEAAGAGAVAGAGQTALHQVGTGITAKDGVKLDRDEIGISGLTGGALAGAFRAPKALTHETLQAVRHSNLDGDMRPAATAVANRVLEKAGGVENLERGGLSALLTGRKVGEKAGYDAVKDSLLDVQAELVRASQGVKLHTDAAENALARAKAGQPLRPHDFTALEEGSKGIPEGPRILDLARQATAGQELSSLGSLNDQTGRFSGGMASKLRDFAVKRPWVTASGMLGVGSAGAMLGTAVLGAPAALAATYGAYRALRRVGKKTGTLYPAKSFVEKFADPDAPVRQPIVEAPPEPAPGRPGPTGPGIKPAPTPWGAEPPALPTPQERLVSEFDAIKPLIVAHQWRQKAAAARAKAEEAAAAAGRREQRLDEMLALRKEDRQLRLEDRQFRIEDRQQRKADQERRAAAQAEREAARAARADEVLALRKEDRQFRLEDREFRRADRDKRATAHAEREAARAARAAEVLALRKEDRAFRLEDRQLRLQDREFRRTDQERRATAQAEREAVRTARADEGWALRKEDRQFRLEDRQLRLQDRDQRRTAQAARDARAEEDRRLRLADRDLRLEDRERRLAEQQRKEQEQREGAALADSVAGAGPLVAQHGGLDVLGAQGFAPRARQLLAAAEAYKRLMGINDPPPEKRAPKPAEASPGGGKKATPPPTEDVYAPTTSDYAHMTPSEAAAHIAQRAVDAGIVPSTRRAGYQRSTLERQQRIYEVAQRLASEVPGAVDAQTLTGWMQMERNRVDARRLREHIRGLYPEEARAVVDSIMSNDAINAIWKKEGKVGRPPADTRPRGTVTVKPYSPQPAPHSPDAPEAPRRPAAASSAGPEDLFPRIREAYLKLSKGSLGQRVYLKDLRRELADVPDDELNAALKAMELADDQGATLMPLDNQVDITPADRDAAVPVGRGERHILWITR